MDRRLLEQVTTIVAHENCADGTASAILLHDALPRCEILFAEYGRSAQALPVRPGMLFCDFSPPPSRVDEFVRAGALVLDHHRSARSMIERFGDRGVYADEVIEPGVSGAFLAFREVWLPLRRGSELRVFAEHFATAAGVRDTWHRSHELWHAGSVQHAALTTFQQCYWLTIPLPVLARDWEQYAVMGEQVLVRKREHLLAELLQGRRFTNANGLRVFLMNAIEVASDAANELEGEVDVVVAFDIVVDSDRPAIRMSLRSHSGFDCARFASRHGGGGHTRAAGCQITIDDDAPQPFRMLETLFAAEALG